MLCSYTNCRAWWLGRSSNSASIKWNKNNSEVTKGNRSIGQIMITFSVTNVRICGEIKPSRQLLISVRGVYGDRHCYLFLEIKSPKERHLISGDPFH